LAYLGVPGFDAGRVEVLVQQAGRPEEVGVEVDAAVERLQRSHQVGDGCRCFLNFEVCIRADLKNFNGQKIDCCI
jgi:hypothetical protein